MNIPFIRDFETPYEQAITVSPLVTRVLARNPGPFTFKGTNAFLVGTKSLALIDPGPAIPDHIEALKRALDGKHLTHILVTHTHLDHSPAAAAIAEWSGARTYAFGAHGSGKSKGGTIPEESADLSFTPDIRVTDGQVVCCDGFTLECVHTPGHTSNHMCFALREEQALFSGDHVMGWSTTVVASPDGDMAQYMASLRKLIAREDTVLYPAHGAAVDNPKPFVQAYLQHRIDREEQILACVRDGINTVSEVVEKIYTAVDSRLHAAAARSVLAHLIKLQEEGQIISNGEHYWTVRNSAQPGGAP